MSEPLDILQISPRVPWPPSDGGAIGIYNITRHLAARGHRVTFVCFGESEGTQLEDEPSGSSTEGTLLEDEPSGSSTGGATRTHSLPMSEFCRMEIVEHDTSNRVWGVMRNLFSRDPYVISKYECRDMFARLDALCDEHRFDVAHVDHAHMAMYGEYVQERHGIPYVLREHNFEATIHRRFAASTRLPLLSQYLHLQAERLYRYEAAALAHPDLIAAITPEDAASIIESLRAPEGRHSPSKGRESLVDIIPAGVDIDRLRPFDAPPDPMHIVILGPLHWHPNLDAALWFCEEIWPRIRAAVPSAHCTIAGAQPPARLRRHAADGIRVPGFVDDLDSLLASASVLAVPLRVGGGMRVKLLEFFARGKAVVATPIGAEGNLARDGEELLLADGAGAFADAIVRVLRNPDLAASLGARARTLVEREYSWTHVAELFERAYLEAMSGRKNHEDTKARRKNTKDL